MLERKNKTIFSILSDEASDCFNYEQVSPVVKYIHSGCVFGENFVGFLCCNLRLPGKSLAQAVLGGLVNVGLDIKNFRVQDYDEAAGISGHINRLSAQISKLNSIPIYTVCHSHCLNLVIDASCNIQCARNVFDQDKYISYFFKFSEPR